MRVYKLFILGAFVLVALFGRSMAYSSINSAHAITFIMPTTTTVPPEGRVMLELSVPLLEQSPAASKSSLEETIRPDIWRDGTSISYWSSVHHENCEDGALDGWLLLDGSDDGNERLWGCDDTRAAKGAMAAWPARGGRDGLDPQTANYPDNMASWMIYGPLDFSNALDVEIKFDLWRETESDLDYLFVGLSEDGRHFFGFTYSGTNDWETITLNFKDYAGKPAVWVAFVFISDASVTFAGPWVDNIDIRQYVENNIYLYQEEAETAPLTGHMAIGTDNDASACQYIYTPSYGSATYTFTAPKNGDYYLWARAMGLAWNQNSFWVSLDGGDLIHFEITPLADQWTWQWSRIIPAGQASAAIHLNAGQHVLQFSGREGNARLDTITITDSGSYRPEGVMTLCAERTPTPVPTITPDIYEPDDTCLESSVLPDESVQTHNFHAPTDEDWVEIPIVVDHRYILSTDNLGSNADTVLFVYQNDCTTVLMANDDGGPGLGSLLTWDAQTNDTFYAQIRPYDDTKTGPNSNYDLTLRSQPLGPITNQENIEFRINQGYSSQVQLRISNPTAETIHVNVSDVNTGSDLLNSASSDVIPMLVESFVPKRTTAQNTIHKDNRAGISGDAVSYRYTGPSSQLQILVYSDDAYHSPSNTFVDQALRYLGLSYTGHYADCSGFQRDLTTGSWDVLLVDHENQYCLGSLWDDIERFIQSGGRAAISTFDIDGSDSLPTTLWNTLGITLTADITDTSDTAIYLWSPTDDLFTVPQEIQDFSHLPDLYRDDGDKIAIIGDSVAKAGFTEGVHPDQAATTTLNRQVIIDSWIPSAANYDHDNNGLMDGVELWMNQISYLTGIRRQDAPWLGETPSQQTLPPGGQVIVHVNANTEGLAVGDHYASIIVSHDGNVLNPIVLPVKLTVLDSRVPLHYFPLYLHGYRNVIPTPTPTPIAVLCDPFEPNDLPNEAWGPLDSDHAYTAKFCQNDTEDVYYFESASGGVATIAVNLPAALNQHISVWLYSEGSVDKPLCGRGPVRSPFVLTCSMPNAGRYLLRISSDGSYDPDHDYIFTATFP